METLLLWKNQITKWFTSKGYSDRKTAFLVISVLLSLFISLFFGYNSYIFWIALIYSLGITFSLSPIGEASVTMKSLKVASAWGFINYSLMVTIISLMVKEEAWGNRYSSGILVACLASGLLVIFCSYISYLLKLNPTKTGMGTLYYIVKRKYTESKYNKFFFGTFASLMLFLCTLGSEHRAENNNKMRIEVKKEKWYPVTEWHSETIDGNTVYVVKCKKGWIGVSPSRCPEVRDINSNSQIKYIAGQTIRGLIIPKEVNIKN